MLNQLYCHHLVTSSIFGHDKDSSIQTCTKPVSPIISFCHDSEPPNPVGRIFRYTSIELELTLTVEFPDDCVQEGVLRSHMASPNRHFRCSGPRTLSGLCWTLKNSTTPKETLTARSSRRSKLPRVFCFFFPPPVNESCVLPTRRS